MSRKARLIAALTVTVLSILILSIALVGIEFRPGQPLAGLGDLPSMRWVGQLKGSPAIILVLRILLIACVVVLPIYIIVNLFTRRGRHKLLVDAIVSSVLLIAAGLLSRIVVPPSSQSVETENVQAESMPKEAPSSENEAPTGQPPPSWLLWSIIAFISVAATAVLARIAFAVLQRRRREAATRAQVAEEAEAAIDSLKGGEDLRDVVIRCYSQMQRIVREERGMQRGGATTPREFLAELEAAGIPAEPVRDLTLLFEEVRYGHAEQGPESERRAIASLTRIASFCRSAA